MKRNWTVMIGTLITLGQFGCSVFGIRSIDEPNYKLLSADRTKNIEIRYYDAFLVAETVVDSSYDKAGSVGFRRLFRFISGDNTAQQSIAMTAPVERYKTGEKIAMTAPVFQEQEKNQWTVSFVMPAKFTAETVPQPTDPTVTIRTIPKRKVAVITFRGRLKEAMSEGYINELKTWCKANGYTPTSEPRLAGYDPPFTLPFLRRNEVHIDVYKSPDEASKAPGSPR